LNGPLPRKLYTISRQLASANQETARVTDVVWSEYSYDYGVLALRNREATWRKYLLGHLPPQGTIPKDEESGKPRRLKCSPIRRDKYARARTRVMLRSLYAPLSQHRHDTSVKMVFPCLCHPLNATLLEWPFPTSLHLVAGYASLSTIHIDACVFDSCVPPRKPEAPQKGASDELVLDSAWQS
jgi:hypothetical protein